MATIRCSSIMIDNRHQFIPTVVLSNDFCSDFHALVIFHQAVKSHKQNKQYIGTLCHRCSTLKVYHRIFAVVAGPKNTLRRKDKLQHTHKHTHVHKYTAQ